MQHCIPLHFLFSLLLHLLVPRRSTGEKPTAIVLMDRWNPSIKTIISITRKHGVSAVIVLQERKIALAKRGCVSLDSSLVFLLRRFILLQRSRQWRVERSCCDWRLHLMLENCSITITPHRSGPEHNMHLHLFIQQMFYDLRSTYTVKSQPMTSSAPRFTTDSPSTFLLFMPVRIPLPAG